MAAGAKAGQPSVGMPEPAGQAIAHLTAGHAQFAFPVTSWRVAS